MPIDLVQQTMRKEHPCQGAQQARSHAVMGSEQCAHTSFAGCLAASVACLLSALCHATATALESLPSSLLLPRLFSVGACNQEMGSHHLVIWCTVMPS